MKYTGITYRPPFEAGSLLLQVTSGCSHNKCSFCYMYKDVPFSVEPIEQVKKDLAEAREYYPDTRRVFLENGDPFSLSARRLIEIGQAIHEYLPKVENISMYASIRNIKGKSDEELAQLRELGFNQFNIGVSIIFLLFLLFLLLLSLLQLLLFSLFIFSILFTFIICILLCYHSVHLNIVTFCIYVICQKL